MAVAPVSAVPPVPALATSRVRPLSTRAAQAEQTRAQILETAQRLFTELGYDATSLQRIADEMGLTKAAVYYHFHAKSDILHAVMEPGIARLALLLDEAETMRSRRARVENLVAGFVDFLVTHRHYAVMASSDPAMKRHKTEGEVRTLRQRGLTLLFGEHPSGADRVAYYTVFSVPETLPELVDLNDDELRDALQNTLLRILRSPS
jgi:AcrR family transcriptional regulator